MLAVTVTRCMNVLCSSERFLVRISKEGFSNYVEKLHSNCTIFTVSLHQSLFRNSNMYDCSYMDCVKIYKIFLFHIMSLTNIWVVFLHNLNNLELLLLSLQ